MSKAKTNPHRYFKRLKGTKSYRLRVGEYRIIANIDDKEIQILVLYIDHRKKIYKRF